MLNLKIFTRGLYSTWCHWPTHNLLFDCGEGCATAIGNALPGIDKIFISHAHGDHINGLPSVVGCRNTVNGTSRNPETMDRNKPLTIYYPGDKNSRMDAVRNFICPEGVDWLRYSLEFVPIREDFILELAKNTFIEPITLLHQRNAITYGYVVYEIRSRLKPEYSGLDIRSLLAEGKISKTELNETYRYNKLAYLFDGYSVVDAEKIKNCEVALIDATFVDPRDRTDPTHFSVDEAMDVLDDAGVKTAYLGHMSPRYDYDTVKLTKERTCGATYLLDPRIVNCI